MTNKEAARVAIECIVAQMKPIAFHANVAMKSQSAPPTMHNDLKRYKKYAEALLFYEAIIAQTEMKL